MKKLLDKLFLFVVLVLYANTTNLMYSQIPFEMESGYPTFTDSIHNFKFIFDSGAKTIINTENGLRLSRSTFLRYDSGYNAANQFIVKKKQKLNIDVKGLGHIKTLATKDIKNGKCNIDIIFGKDIMHGKVLHFDFKNKLFYYLDYLPNDLNGFTKVAIEKNFRKTYYLPLNIHSQLEYYIIDMGYYGTLLTDQKKIFNEVTKIDARITTFGKDYIKELPVDTNVVIELGKDKIPFKTTLYYMKPIYDNLIGMEFFSSFDEVIFDFKNLAIYFKNYNYNPINIDNYIIIYKNEESGYSVNAISRESKYYKKGIRLNQKLKVKHEELAILLSNADECKHYIIIAEWLQTHELEALFEVL